MKRRVQGLCLIFLGAVLGWSSGGDLRKLARSPGGLFDPNGALYDTLWVGGKLLLALGVIFVGLVFLAGLLARRTEEPDGARRSPHK